MEGGILTIPPDELITFPLSFLFRCNLNLEISPLYLLQLASWMLIWNIDTQRKSFNELSSDTVLSAYIVVSDGYFSSNSTPLVKLSTELLVGSSTKKVAMSI